MLNETAFLVDESDAPSWHLLCPIQADLRGSKPKNCAYLAALWFKLLQSNAMRDLGKSRVVGKNAFTNNRPGPGGVVYIQQMLVNNNKWVITNAKVNPKSKMNKRQML